MFLLSSLALIAFTLVVALAIAAASSAPQSASLREDLISESTELAPPKHDSIAHTGFVAPPSQTSANSAVPPLIFAAGLQ